jgi:hypothetical protein
MPCLSRVSRDNTSSVCYLQLCLINLAALLAPPLWTKPSFYHASQPVSDDQGSVAPPSSINSTTLSHISGNLASLAWPKRATLQQQTSKFSYGSSIGRGVAPSHLGHLFAAARLSKLQGQKRLGGGRPLALSPSTCSSQLIIARLALLEGPPSCEGWGLQRPHLASDLPA